MSENTYDTTTHGSFTLRVPYDKYETVYNALCASDAGWAVRSASSQVPNMTKQYSKLTAQIEAYERATGKPIVKPSNISGSARMNGAGDLVTARRTSLPTVSRELAKTAVEAVVSAW